MASAHLGDRIKRGRVHGRYFRENFAQGGLDLSQILVELVTNADAAITAAGRDSGRIELFLGPPDPGQRERWQRESRALGLAAGRPWRTEVRCADDGIGINAERVDARLGVLGGLPENDRQRGLFGRGLRDVWLAQGRDGSREYATGARSSLGSYHRPARIHTSTSTCSMSQTARGRAGRWGCSAAPGSPCR